MDFSLRVAGAIDSVNEAVARAARWTLLANALLFAGNAIGRKFFSTSSPIIYDLQWHFFAEWISSRSACASAEWPGSISPASSWSRLHSEFNV